MAYFETCPHCGSNLDPGEKCDCAKEGGIRDAGRTESRVKPVGAVRYPCLQG